MTRWIVLLAALGICTSAAAAETHYEPAGDFVFDLPQSWKIRWHDTEDVAQLENPDGRIRMTMEVWPTADVQEAWVAMVSDLRITYGEGATGEALSNEINGMWGRRASGSIKTGGSSRDRIRYYVMATPKRALLVKAIIRAEEPKLSALEEQVRQFTFTIRPPGEFPFSTGVLNSLSPSGAEAALALARAVRESDVDKVEPFLGKQLRLANGKTVARKDALAGMKASSVAEYLELEGQDWLAEPLGEGRFRVYCPRGADPGTSATLSPNGKRWTLTAIKREEREPFLVEGNELQLPFQIVFSTSSAKLEPDSKYALEYVKAYLDAKAYVSMVRIEVHSDAGGDARANQTLTELRALALARSLVAEGVDCKRLLPVGFGSAKPIADNDTPAGRAENRRTRFVNAGYGGKPIDGQPADGEGKVAGSACSAAD